MSLRFLRHPSFQFIFHLILRCSNLPPYIPVHTSTYPTYPYISVYPLSISGPLRIPVFSSTAITRVPVPGQAALDSYVAQIVAALRDFPYLGLDGGRPPVSPCDPYTALICHLVSSYELSSPLHESSSITPVVLPYVSPYIAPFKQVRQFRVLGLASFKGLYRGVYRGVLQGLLRGILELLGYSSYEEPTGRPQLQYEELCWSPNPQISKPINT